MIVNGFVPAGDAAVLEMFNLTCCTPHSDKVQAHLDALSLEVCHAVAQLV
jgi:hypothetical protein